MALEKELQETLAGRSQWQGSADRLWANFAQAINVEGAEGVDGRAGVSPRPSPWRWRVPAWAAAAVVVLVAGAWALRPGMAPVAPPPPASGAEQLGRSERAPGPEKHLTPGPGANAKAPTNPTHMEAPAHPGPPPTMAMFDITAGSGTFALGQAVQLTVRFRNEGSEAIQLEAAVPQLRINPASADYDVRQPAMDSLALPALAGRTLAPGEAVSIDVVWAGSKAAPGWYRAELSLIQYQFAGHPATIGGGGTAFFIQYPPGAVKVGTVESGAAASLHGITLTVRKVEFTEQQTKLYFHLSKLRAPAEFGLALERSGGLAGGSLGRSHKDSPEGGIEGVAEFDPTPAGEKSITVVVPELSVVHVGQGMERLTGPWRVTVPLN